MDFFFLIWRPQQTCLRDGKRLRFYMISSEQQQQKTLALFI